MKFLILLVITLCSCAHRQIYPSYEEAWSLRGLSFEEVSAKLKSPADKKSNELAYWFLRSESKYHPEPGLELYEFIFASNKLISIRKSKKDHDEGN